MKIEKNDTFDVNLSPYGEIKLGNNLIFSESEEKTTIKLNIKSVGKKFYNVEFILPKDVYAKQYLQKNTLLSTGQSFRFKNKWSGLIIKNELIKFLKIQ